MFKNSKNIAVILLISMILFFLISLVDVYVSSAILNGIIAAILFLIATKYLQKKIIKKKPCPQCDKHKKFKEDYQKMIENSQKKRKQEDAKFSNP